MPLVSPKPLPELRVKGHVRPRKLIARSTYPGVSLIPLYRDPLARLARIFGLRR